MAKTIAIIGGGAAGMMAALAAKEAGHEYRVTLFEKNVRLGAKVLISGGGRCNVTTGITDVRELLKNYPRGAKFLMTAMHQFTPEAVIEWFEAHGVPLKTEPDLRVFPVSDDGHDVVNALEQELARKGIEIRRGAIVEKIIKAGEAFKIILKGGHEEGADAVILTTGGNAYRHTGSTGDGYDFAQAFGHTITPLGPSLSAWVVRESWANDLAGVSFQKAKLALANREGRSYERIGAFLFTHRGVSGPTVFALSSFVAHQEITPEKPLQLLIDFFPDESSDILNKKFVQLIQNNPQKKVENVLDIWFPKSLCGVFTTLTEIPREAIAGNITREQRVHLLKLFKALPLTVVGRAPGDEFVTAGGVELSEVDSRTMQSKKCPGLYFAGELLDVDGFTGGFNLQASWATGRLAGQSAAG